MLRNKTEQTLKECGLYEKRCFPARQMSGGEKRRLAVAGILAMERNIIIFDEPFANLDYPGVLQVSSILKNLKQQGKTVIVSGWGCNCVIGDDGKITLTSTNTEDYQVVIGYIHKCSLKANKTYYFRAFDIINIDHIGIGKVGSDDLLKSFTDFLAMLIPHSVKIFGLFIF